MKKRPILGALLIPTALLAQTFTTIDYPGAAATLPYAITADGDVLGAWRDDGGNFHAFYLMQGKTVVSFDCQGAVSTRPRAINARGEAAGVLRDDRGAWHGFYLDMASPSSWEAAGAKCKIIDPKGTVGRDANVGAFGISDAGEIAGEYDDELGLYHAYLLRGGVFMVFDLVEGPWNGAFAISPQGVLMGHLQANGDRMKGWILTQRTLQTIEFPPGENNSMSCPFGANSKGDIVGHYQRINEQVRGFHYRDGRFTSIEVPNSTATNALGINDAGLIVGYYNDKAGKTHGFLMRQ